jgi:hypothetical protein
MVDISAEAPHQIEARLRSVIRLARIQIFDELYRFEEFPAADFGDRFDERALALVRDGDLWSQLVPFREGGGEAFRPVRVPFPAGPGQ